MRGSGKPKRTLAICSHENDILTPFQRCTILLESFLRAKKSKALESKTFEAPNKVRLKAKGSDKIELKHL